MFVVGIDGLDRVDDWQGHDTSDRVRIALVERMRELVGDARAVAWLGGDEVMLVWPSSGRTVAERAAELVQAVREPVVVDGASVQVSSSVGTTAVDQALDVEAALRRADVAMHEARRRGGDRAVPYSPQLDRERVDRLDLVTALRSAIAGRELRVVYQPVFDLGRGLVVGVEALCRWERAGHPVPPDVFVATAEENGLIEDLGALVLDLVRCDAPVIAQAAGRRLNLAVNVSPRQLRDPAFPDLVRDALPDIDPLGLVLEITERDVMDDDPVARAGMAVLTDAGVVFAVDDFGVGYSSLSYLQHLPVGILKVDRTFVESIDSDERACTLLGSIAQLARGLDLDVCVEGIERLGQVQHVLDHVGRVCGQGYYLGRPMTLPALVGVLREQQDVDARPADAATLVARGSHA